MLTIKIHIGEGIRKDIKDTYGKDNYATVSDVVNNIFDRYLGVGYFDPELVVGEDNYKNCEACGEKSKAFRMIDVDRKNIEEHEVCENCGAGYPGLR
jgi:hypothetical protein